MTAARALSLAIARVSYGDRIALRDVRLEIAPGEIVGIAGHVGAGKTTLALAAAGLLGRAVPAIIDGTISHPLGGRPPASYVFANPWTQLTELGGTVEEEVAVGPENQALASPAIRARVDRSLALADATPLATRVPHTLSGGELQRVALASALALDARLVVLDEPTAQLDPESATSFTATLRAMRDSGRAVLLVEQNLDVLLALADRLVVLADGGVLAAGDPRELLARWPPLDPRLGAPASVDRAHEARSREPVTSEPLLEVLDLTSGYGERVVLSDLSTTVPAGSVVAWLGRNGAGKTTLARTIVGLVPARSGSIRVIGQALDGLAVERRARFVGLVFQDPGRQLFSRSVLEEALFGPRAQGVPSAVARSNALEVLDAVGLGGRERDHPGDLSPQAQRRLAVACAMASRPPLLILDEPTAGQDAEGREHIARALELQRERGAAVVITHDRRFVTHCCDEAVTLAAGRVSSTGVPRARPYPPRDPTSSTKPLIAE